MLSLSFGIILDTFNDKENALVFWTSPAGIRGDVAVSADGGMNNDSWNTYWDAAAVKNNEGWFAEIRIPFSSLGFKRESEIIKIGLITYRFIARKNEMQLYPSISPNWNVTTPSKAGEVILKNIICQKPVYITPYLIGGAGRINVLNESANTYITEKDFIDNAGLDVKYNLSYNLTLDATINTDFAQVEADNQEVNLTRFSLFFPEKRQFFQERAGIFNFNTSVGNPDRLFHSRKIGIYNGREVPIFGGLRLVGRTGKWDIGFFGLQTKKTEELPSENFGVLRLRKQVFNENSYAGGMLTSRTSKNGNNNIAYGLDGIFRLFGNEYLTLKWSQTFDEDIQRNQKFNFIKASSFQVMWQNRDLEHLGYMLSVSRAGEDFQPGMGFTTRQDYTEYVWNVSYNIFKDEESKFRQLSPFQLYGFVAARNSNGSIESAQLEYDTDFIWKSGASVWFDVEAYYESLTESASFPRDTEIPAGNYTFYKIEGGYNPPVGDLFRTNFSFGF